MEQSEIKLFEGKNIRYVWDEEKEQYFFSVVDVIQVLTDSAIPRRYWSDLKRKLAAEGSEVYEKIVQLKLPAQVAREQLEHELGVTVISDKRALHFTNPPDELPLNTEETLC